MFDKHSCNMKTGESIMRTLAATSLLIYAILNTSIFLGIVSVVIYYTAFTKFCFMYYLFKINEKFSIQNYYLSLLPKYRTSPLFIFDKKGKIIFKNSASEELLSNIQSVLDIEVEEYIELIEQSKTETTILELNDKFYQIELRGIKNEDFLLAYFTDITEIMQLREEIEETQREIIYAMGEIGETRSKETGNHVKRVALYSELLASLHGMNKEEASLLKMASPMHDIGKVGIPDAILNAPRKLNNDEWAIMKTHAQIGYDMLKSSNKPILQAAATVAHEHHEKYDGSGYPDAKVGENIHIYGRITAVVDVFDALISKRVYKEAWDLKDVLELFEKESGKHFDPKLIKLFMDNLDKFLEIRDKHQD